MAGYIGSKASVTQVDGYNRTEADSEFVQVAGDTMTGALAATDLTLSGGVYLGGTGSANKLDDYETGTFTPIIDPTGAAGSGTYTTQVGSYVRIGDLVHVNIRLGWSAHTGTGGMRITGLPFTSSNSYAGLSVSYRDGLTISSGHTCNVAVIPSNTLAYVYEISTGTDNASLVAMDSVVADISISGTYTAA